MNWGWSGGASVFASDVEPTINVNGDWVGVTSPVTRAVDGFVDPFEGIELSLLGSTPQIFIAPGGSLDIDLDFQGYSSATSSNSNSGFLSLGLADFSGTGSISYTAVDAATGLPTNDVTITLVGVPAPGGTVLGFVLLNAGIACNRRRRFG